MSNILEEGFLATDINFWIQENKHNKGAEINLAYDTNRLAQEVFVNTHPSGDRGLMLSSLLARLLEHFQGVVLLEERNLSNSSTALARILLETSFSLVACVRHDDFHYKLADWDASRVKKLGNHLQKVSQEASPLTSLEIDKIKGQVASAELEIKELQERNKNLGLSKDNELKVFRIAEYAGMEDFYHSIYSFFSTAVHSATRSVGNHVEIDEKNGIKNIVWGPEQPRQYALSTSIAIMLHSIGAYIAFSGSNNSYLATLNLLVNRLEGIENVNISKAQSL